VFELPSTAAWRHRDARLGFEVLFVRHDRGCLRLEGHSTAVEEEEAWAIRYDLTVDERWVTRSAHVVARSALGVDEVRLEADGIGVWQIDGKAAPWLGGCLDVDLEASACTNALPIHRLGLSVGERADAPAAYVRARMLGFRTMARARATSTSRRRSISVRFSPTTGSGSCSTTQASRSELLDSAARARTPSDALIPRSTDVTIRAANLGLTWGRYEA
jgi:uncharacterized protein